MDAVEDSEIEPVDFHQSFTEDASLNLQAYHRHFKLLNEAMMANEGTFPSPDTLDSLSFVSLSLCTRMILFPVVELLGALEDVEVDMMPRRAQDTEVMISTIKQVLEQSTDPLNDTRRLLKNALPTNTLNKVETFDVFFQDPTTKRKIVEGSKRSIGMFSYDNGMSHSTAFLRYAPRFATIISALPKMISRRKAYVAPEVTVIATYPAEKGSGLVNVILRVAGAQRVETRMLSEAARQIAKAELAGKEELEAAMAKLDACMPKHVEQTEETEADTTSLYGEHALAGTDLARFIDVPDDIGGSKQEVDISPGSICWLSAIPSASLPIIPRHLLAEQGIGNVGHNLVQASLAANNHQIALEDVCSYHGLSARPYLVNQLWTQMKGHKSNLVDNGSRDFGPKMLDMYGKIDGKINIPIPTPLCPLEGIMLSVQKDYAKIEVKMPLALARQWFPDTPTPLLASHPVPLATNCNDVVQVTALAKHHILAQSQWPLSTPPQTNWMLVAGPQQLMHNRLMKALNTMTSANFLGSDAVRHIICRMDGLPIMDPYAPARALQRVLGLSDQGYYVPEKSNMAVIEQLQETTQGNMLLAAIKAPTRAGFIAPETVTQELDATHHWMRLRRLTMTPLALRVIAAYLRANEVGCFARLSTLVEPTSRLERTQGDVDMDKTLRKRLRKLEFEKDSYMPTDDVSGDQNTDVEEIVPVSKAGRFYFRRMHIADPTMATKPADYQWQSSATVLPASRVNQAALIGDPANWKKTFQTFYSYYKHAPQNLSFAQKSFVFPKEQQRAMHPQANHNPLPREELLLAKQILEQVRCGFSHAEHVQKFISL